jgi:hypothetical protein
MKCPWPDEYLVSGKTREFYATVEAIVAQLKTREANAIIRVSEDFIMALGLEKFLELRWRLIGKCLTLLESPNSGGEDYLILVKLEELFRPNGFRHALDCPSCLMRFKDGEGLQKHTQEVCSVVRRLTAS